VKLFEIEIVNTDTLIIHIRDQSAGQKNIRLIAELPGVVKVFSAPYILKISKARVYDWRDIVVPMFTILGLPIPEEYIEDPGVTLPHTPPFTPAGGDIQVAWQFAAEKKVEF
jgi:hypothetical protein